MLEVICKDGRSYLRHVKTQRLWRYHFKSEDDARKCRTVLLNDWEGDTAEQFRDLAANFVENIDETLPAE